LDKYSICKQSHHFSHFSSHHTWRSIQQHYLSLISLYNTKRWVAFSLGKPKTLIPYVIYDASMM
jgi:hypothetical protein